MRRFRDSLSAFFAWAVRVLGLARCRSQPMRAVCGNPMDWEQMRIGGSGFDGRIRIGPYRFLSGSGPCSSVGRPSSPCSLFLALVGLLFRLRLLGLALLPAGHLPERALDAASGLFSRVAHLPERALDAATGLLSRVAHRLGGALAAATGLLGRVAHRLGGALDAATGLLGRVAHRLGGALDAATGLLGRVAHRLGGAL